MRDREFLGPNIVEETNEIGFVKGSDQKNKGCLSAFWDTVTTFYPFMNAYTSTTSLEVIVYFFQLKHILDECYS